MATLQSFLQAHPQVENVELVVTDPNGICRGKWAPVATLKKAFGEGVNFPLSLHGLDVWGNEVAATGLHISSGDLDGFYTAIPHTLSLVPWGTAASENSEASAGAPTTAQVMLETNTPDHSAFQGCSRRILQKAVDRLTAKSLTAVCAFELEFHLLKPENQWQNGAPQVAEFADAPQAQYMYGLDALSNKSPYFADLRRAAAWADLPIDTIVKEAGPGQYEVNLNHRADALRAADDVVLLKRIVREVARMHGMIATFMAKPYLGEPGNGMHVHTSLLDGAGTNIFSGEAGTVLQHHAVAGLVKTMAEMTLIFANTHNGFRRMAPGSYAPTRANWGANNRSVAVRLPAAPDQAKRVEHRVSGADANPYLVLAAILNGMIDGLESGEAPPPELTGNAYESSTPHRGESLPSSQADALSVFAGSSFAKRALGETMHALLCTIKQAEIDGFLNDMSPLERRTFL